jgi:hypothetical protein
MAAGAGKKLGKLEMRNKESGIREPFLVPGLRLIISHGFQNK